MSEEIPSESLTYLERRKLLKKLRKLLKVVYEVENLAPRVELELHCAHIIKVITGGNYESEAADSTK